MAAAGVDVPYLAAHLGVPETELSNATTVPTAELVSSILQAVAVKAHEFDALVSEKFQLEVTLEASVRGAEAQRDASNETAKKALKDVEEVRQKLQEEETKRQSLENELQSIKSTSSTSQSELDTLRARIASLETSNREYLGIVDTKIKANEELSNELQAQHQKIVKLNQEITAMQQTVHNANSAASSAKFREQSLKQQVEMAQRNSDFFENELKTKAAEAVKFRKEKNARITELQRMNEDATATIESLKRTEQQLRQRLDDAQKKADEALTKVQQLQEAAGRREEDFRQEGDSLRRLVDMKEQQTVTLKNLAQELEGREESVKRECESKVRQVNEELARVSLDKEELTQANETLRAEIGRLEAMHSGNSPGQQGSAPQTPRALNGSAYRAGSPFATPASARKSLSATQALDDLFKIKGQLNVEKQRSSNLAKELDEVISQLEAKGPELEELHAENERLQEDIKNMSHLSDESFRERDAAKKAARNAEKAAMQAEVTIKILREQLRSLAAQVQMLTFNVEVCKRGQEAMTPDEALYFQKLERGQVEGDDSGEGSDINSMILQRLAVFKDIQTLQEKNEQLLLITHELGQKMESEEAIAEKHQAVEDHNERIRLQQELEVFRDTLKGFQIQAESITKERDLFRRIVEQRASAEELNSALGRSTQDGVLASIEQNSTMNDDGSDYTTLLRELQQNFDQYRNEQATDRKTMKEQAERLAAEKSSLQAEISKITSQLHLASERYEMLQSNFAAVQNENKELQKRNQTVSESAAKQDIRTQQVVEDLIEARGLAESMRNENANLKAEKKLWKDIQDRLSQDNENLMQEKSRLNGLLATHQNLQNERETSEAETKRRLQAQVDSLETELNSTKRKLSDEVEEAKKAQLRREFDAQQSQKRIDELTTNLSQIREELVAAKTSRDHLQARVEELTIQLRSAEERAERLQPRPTPRASIAPGTLPDTSLVDTDERIQELIHEATDLKRDLDMTKSHLENAQVQAEKYKELSQASEEELERLTSAQEQYTQEMESALAAKDAKIKELEQRVEDLSSELSRSNNELTSLRDSQAEVARRFEDEKALLNEEIKRLKDQEEHYTQSSQFHQKDLRAQADIAANAQQAYENEVMKHGETAKTLASIREEYTQLRTTVNTSKAEAESAKALLLQNESSWEERRQKFEQELSELRARRDDANAQNKLLHEQLENVTAQVTALQQTRASTGESLESIAAQPSGSDADRFRELSNYLRREKDILEVQYDLKVQEARRLQTQLEYTQSQLDDSRLKLEQERQSQGDRDRSTMAQKDLMKTIEELNVYRESSATLRTQAQQAQARLTEKTAKITELEATIQPLEAQIEELQSQQSFKEAELKQLQEDRDRWQKRTEDILSKHGRTDPAELEELKQTVKNLEAERDTLREAEGSLKAKISELEASQADQQAKWNETKDRLINSAKERSRVLTAAKNGVIAEKDQLQAKLDEANGELATMKQTIQDSESAKLSAQEEAASFKRQVESMREEARNHVAPPQEPAPTGTTNADSVNSEALSALQTQLTNARAELESVTAQKASLEEELQTVRTQLETAVTEKDQALSNTQTQRTNEDSSMENGVQQHEDKPANTLSDDERRALEEKVAAAEAKSAELEAKIKELQDNHDSIIKSRSDKMKDALNKRLNEAKANIESERAQMKADKEKLEADFNLRMEQERKIWEAEHGGKPAEGQAPQTPQQPKTETPAATPTTAAIPNLTGMSDQEVRDMVTTNPTLMGIVANNVKNKLAVERKKMREEQEAAMKAEIDQKVAQAKQSQTELIEKKAHLKLNMTENRVRAANAKLGVVETAAKETPQRPVVEVWEVAKDAKPPPAPKPPGPAPTAAPAAASGTNNTTAPASQPAPSAQASAKPTGQEQKSAPATGLPQPGVKSSLPNHPFTGAQQPPPTQQPAANSFAQSGQQQSQIPKASGLPRKASGPGVPARGGGRGGRGGRGGAQGRASLDPSADNFQPGAKRPRGDSEAGNGPKRARGGGPQ